MKNLSPINPTRITNASLQANYDSNIENIDFTLFYHYIYLYMQSAQNEAEVSCVINKASLFMNASILSKHNQEQNIRQSRSDEIYYKFIYYVRQFAPAKHHISFYSGKLCISSQYLSTIVKEVSGKTARVWIDDFIILEAKILLEHTLSLIHI